MTEHRLLLPALLALTACRLPRAPLPAAAPSPTPPAARKLDFRTAVYPLLVARCLRCHPGPVPPSAPRPDHWAFRPLSSPPVPAVRNSAWPLTPIDAFLASAHERHGFTPAPEASRRTLIRRLTLDLTGIPPTPEEVDAFVADPAPDA